MATAQKKQGAQGLPDNVIGLLDAADTRNGLPPGTMYSIMQQEVGGQFDRFMADPSAYHYEADAKGRRIAGHTGKESTAFGPFGILESTAEDPGYGVTPLKDKSLEEQVRFASDYLVGRSKKNGLKAGLAGYGEGADYATQVEDRIPGQAFDGVLAEGAQTDPADVLSHPGAPYQPSLQEQWQALAPAQEVAAAAPAQGPATTPTQLGPDPWQQFLEAGRQPQPMQVADLNYGAQRPAGITVPGFSAAVAEAKQNQVPNFNMLSALRGFE